MLATVLVIESSTAEGSVAVLSGDAVAASVQFSARDSVSGVRTEAVGPAVAQCLAGAGVPASGLSAVVCGAGPGGFTSLRCAAAIAKGLCSALAIPLYAVSSLDLIAWSAPLCEGMSVVAITAGRGDWFAALVRCDAEGAREIGTAMLLSEVDLHSLASQNAATLVGPGLDIDVHPRAEAALMCIRQIEDAGPISLDAWEPTYGRLAEAQVKWEAAHGRALPV